MLLERFPCSHGILDLKIWHWQIWLLGYLEYQYQLSLSSLMELKDALCQKMCCINPDLFHSDIASPVLHTMVVVIWSTHCYNKQFGSITWWLLAYLFFNRCMSVAPICFFHSFSFLLSWKKLPWPSNDVPVNPILFPLFYHFLWIFKFYMDFIPACVDLSDAFVEKKEIITLLQINTNN